MEPRTIRLPQYLWDQIDALARIEGLTTSQFIRESMVARVGFLIGRANPDADELYDLADDAPRRAKRVHERFSAVIGPLTVLLQYLT